ncbi:MAG: hypothetical protein WCP46_00500 [Alphaproteobacteria bacterium]
MKKKAQCILLDTEQPSKLVFSTSKYGGLFKSEHYSPMKEMGDSYKHLYFTSDEEIKEGDWFINLLYNTVKQASNWIYVSTCKKIVATTNPELFKNTKYNMDMAKNSWFNALHRAESPILIPRIGDDFVEAYIKAYNEGHPITEVMLDYTFDAVKQWIGHTSRENYRPKLRSNGTVIISPVVEKMYSKDELLDIITDYEMRMSGYKEKSKEWYKERIDAWLRNHYPQ